MALHFYSQSPTLRFNCPPGDYEIFVAANLHKDLAEKSIKQLVDYKISSNVLYQDLPMSAHRIVTINPDNGFVVTLPTIQMRRNVAKIAFNIEVDKSVPDIKLAGFQVFNIPTPNSYSYVCYLE